VRSRRLPILLGIVSMVVYVIYAVFVFNIAPPTGVRPFYILNPTVGDVKYIATYVVFTSVPLIGTDMYSDWALKGWQRPEATADAYDGTLKAFLMGNAILYGGALIIEGLTHSFTPPVDYVLYVIALTTGVLFFTTMRRYYLGLTR